MILAQILFRILLYEGNKMRAGKHLADAIIGGHSLIERLHTVHNVKETEPLSHRHENFLRIIGMHQFLLLQPVQSRSTWYVVADDEISAE